MHQSQKTLIVTDNGFLYSRIRNILLSDFSDLVPTFEFRRSKGAIHKKLYNHGIESLEAIDVKEDYHEIIKNYSTVISLHCKQIFPAALVNNVLCINIHPGMNPYNRGWYPQIFAIMNHGRLGATIHIMDEKVDHGPIIDREEVEIKSYYTSKEAYEKTLDAEIDLFKNNLRAIVDRTFNTIEPEFEGDFYSIKDFHKLCELDMDEQLPMGEAINKLRALSHGDYKNAYFYDDEGNKIYVKVELLKE